MNDIFLFRAKRADNAERVEGNYECDPDLDNHYICGFDCYLSENGLEREFFTHEVNKNTICRCTGLKDKNGRLIWENDILMGHGNPEDLAKTVFGEFDVIDAETLEKVDKVVGWHYKVIPTDYISKCEPFCLPMPLTDFYIRICEYEVIGNIFDNPELFEVE